MSVTERQPLSNEEESRRVAEESRETEWGGCTFLRELFLGNFALGLIHLFSARGEDRPEFRKFYADGGRRWG